MIEEIVLVDDFSKDRKSMNYVLVSQSIESEQGSYGACVKLASFSQQHQGSYSDVWVTCGMHWVIPVLELRWN